MSSFALRSKLRERPAPSQAFREAPQSDRYGGVLALQRSAGNRAVAQLLRQPSAPPAAGRSSATLMREPTTAPARSRGASDIVAVTRNPKNADQVFVSMGDGSRYRVTRSPAGRRVVADPGAPRITLESDNQRVWMRVAWCRGTRGQIDFGANPQGALAQLMNTIGTTILSGGGASAVVQAIEQAQLQPFLDVDVAQSRQWRITGNIGVGLNPSGVTSVTGTAELDVGWMRVGVQGSVSDLQGNRQEQVGLTFTFPLGPREAPRHRCEPQVVEVGWAYSCQRERLTPVRIQSPPIPRHREETRTVYFEYATADVNPDLTGGELDTLRDRLREGYRVTRVDGFTSPEGPRAAGRRFMGNVALGEARARAALALAVDPQRCPGGRICVDPNVEITGHSELPPLTRTVRRRGREEEVELQGRQLDSAVTQWFLDNQEEMDRLPAEEQDRIRNERNPHRAAQRIYPWLRRAEIHLRRDWLEPGRPVTTDLWMPEGRGGSCPDNVRQAAEGVWLRRNGPRR